MKVTAVVLAIAALTIENDAATAVTAVAIAAASMHKQIHMIVSEV
jgi:hypothetical protein